MIMADHTEMATAHQEWTQTPKSLRLTAKNTLQIPNITQVSKKCSCNPIISLKISLLRMIRDCLNWYDVCKERKTLTECNHR